jgi:hypothetical protein
MKGLRVAFALFFALVAATVAFARDASVITKFPGEGQIFRTSADGSWLAGWVLQPDGVFKLMVVSSAKGDRQEVTTSRRPGGISWVPGTTQLLYSTAIYNDAAKVNKVDCYIYDVAAKTRKRVLETNDQLETYSFDPIAAEDGSKVLQITMDPVLSFPSFNVYFKAEGRMKNLTGRANIGTLYDLSSDGNTLFWWMRDPRSNELNIVSWDMNSLTYQDIFTFPRNVDPAEDWALFKVDAPNKQAAISAFSEKDPSLQIVVYYYGNPKNLYTKAIRFGQGELVPYFDWKGRSGTIYCVVNYTGTGEYGIEEIDPVSGKRIPVYRGKEPIEYVEYVTSTQAYYFSHVSRPGSSRAETRLVRVK